MSDLLTDYSTPLRALVQDEANLDRAAIGAFLRSWHDDDLTDRLRLLRDRQYEGFDSSDVLAIGLTDDHLIALACRVAADATELGCYAVAVEFDLGVRLRLVAEAMGII